MAANLSRELLPLSASALAARYLSRDMSILARWCMGLASFRRHQCTLLGRRCRRALAHRSLAPAKELSAFFQLLAARMPLGDLRRMVDCAYVASVLCVA